MTTLGHQVERLGLDRGPVYRDPLHVISGQLCVGSLFGILGDGFYGRGAIDGLLRANHIG